MRERIAIVIMVLSLLAAVGLGAAVAGQLGKGGTIQAAGVTTMPSPTATGNGGTAAVAGTAATAGRTVTTGSTGSSGVGNVSSSSAGVANGLITVGGIYDETGPVDSTVERDTIRAYFNKINEAGGVNGYKFRLLDCDSAYDPTQAHQCTQRLLSQGVLAFVGSNSVSGEEAETKYLNDQGVPVIGGLGVDSEFNLPLSFPVVSSFVTDGTATGAHAALMGIKHPGIVLANLNFIKPAEQALLDSLHKHGIQEKSVDLVDISKPDYTDIVIKLRNEGVDSVLAGLDPYSYARFFQAMERANWYPKFGGLGLDKPSAQAEYGKAVYGAESLTSVHEMADHMNVPVIRDYYDTVKRYFPNQVPALDYFSEGDWVAAKVFVEAIRRVKGPLTRKSLVDALYTFKNFDTGFTVPISYTQGPKHDPVRCLEWIRNENGDWKTYSGWNCF